MEQTPASRHSGLDGSFANVWPDAELVVVDAGHTGNDEMRSAIEAALHRFGS